MSMKNHMFKHQVMEHGGREPSFTMKVIKFYKTPLARQVAEAIRIRRRGGEGAILNSKGEFTRCYIPRLRVEEQDLEEEKEQRRKEDNMREQNIRRADVSWEQNKS